MVRSNMMVSGGEPVIRSARKTNKDMGNEIHVLVVRSFLDFYGFVLPAGRFATLNARSASLNKRNGSLMASLVSLNTSLRDSTDFTASGRSSTCPSVSN